jgi:uncharacterized damage-inducible protein DinB
VQLDEIKTLYKYNYWANGLVLTECAKLEESQLQIQLSAGTRTLRQTLVHQLDTDWSWRLRCEGQPDDEEMTEADLPTIEAIRARWAQDEREMWDYLNSLREEQFTSMIRYPVVEGYRERPLWTILLHVINHSTQHRSEVAAMLTSVGFSPGDLDLSVYLYERDQG